MWIRGSQVRRNFGADCAAFSCACAPQKSLLLGMINEVVPGNVCRSMSEQRSELPYRPGAPALTFACSITALSFFFLSLAPSLSPLLSFCVGKCCLRVRVERCKERKKKDRKILEGKDCDWKG